MVASTGWNETKLQVQIPRLLGATKSFGQCEPHYGPPALLDNFMKSGGGDPSQGLVNRSIRNLAIYQKGIELGVIKETSKGVKRIKALDPESAALFEYALDLGDVPSLKFFSITYMGHFLGAGARLNGKPIPPIIPDYYATVDGLRAWYANACQDENIAAKPGFDIEGSYFKQCYNGDIECYKKQLTKSHTQSDNTSAAYWSGGSKIYQTVMNTLKEK
jgi:hypothetical protein